jgi:hypothetical protein
MATTMPVVSSRNLFFVLTIGKYLHVVLRFFISTFLLPVLLQMKKSALIQRKRRCLMVKSCHGGMWPHASRITHHERKEVIPMAKATLTLERPPGVAQTLLEPQPDGPDGLPFPLAPVPTLAVWVQEAQQEASLEAQRRAALARPTAAAERRPYGYD